jgi:alkylated DNA repair protein (DNA oxidative demethylase)
MLGSGEMGGAGPRTSRRGPTREVGHYYFPDFVSVAEGRAVLEWLATLRPIWERRHRRGAGAERWLLRPVYWLGSWQFACLDYYRPPNGVAERCVRAEPFPKALRELVARAERLARERFRPPDLPGGWRLNTCLVNFYGSRLEDGRWVDAARVGEHRDFEPGPVASISLGERALLQFIARSRPGEIAPVVLTQWLDDRSLQLFGGRFFKDQTLHRVQRVDRRSERELPPAIEGFRTRRVNFTFRYVPDEHVLPFAELSTRTRDDVREYVQRLAEGSSFFRRALAAAPRDSSIERDGAVQ